MAWRVRGLRKLRGESGNFSTAVKAKREKKERIVGLMATFVHLPPWLEAKVPQPPLRAAHLELSYALQLQ